MSLPQGFRLAAAAADFRGKGKTRDDLALVVSDRPAAAAGVFTTNLFRAAPVLVAQEHLARAPEQIRGILINSGQANACTGGEGMAQCRESLTMVAEATGLNAETLLPASTGVIGALMDMEKWRAAVPDLAASLGHTDLERFARAIMTTDAFPKLAEAEVALDGGTVRLAGVAKGAGMICPNMATMISLVLCDAEVDAAVWRDMFRRAADATFNRVSVDGDTSTNDSLFGLANGASGIRVKEEELPVLEEALTDILGDLAYMLVKDGEGATKVLHINVTGAASNADAEKVARTVGHSQLVKTAMFGKGPNWGRIVAAAGRSGAVFNPNSLSVQLCGGTLFHDGRPTTDDFDTLLREPLDGTDVTLDICLGDGPGTARLLASDLSHAYVSLNADYRS